MGEAQWFQPTVNNRLSRTIILVNFRTQFGKFFDINNQFIDTVSAAGTKIASQGEHQWGHSGRENSPFGTEGFFEVHIEETGEKIAKIYWDCPCAVAGQPAGDNKLEKHDVKQGYDITFDGFSISSGALGKGKINVREALYWDV